VLELRFGCTRNEFQPCEAIALARFAGKEIAIQLRQVGQYGQRTVRLGRALVAHGDLEQVRIVYPDLPAIGDDELAIRFERLPAELARSLERERAACLVTDFAVRGGHRLGPVRAYGLQVRTERFHARARTFRGQRGRANRHEQQQGDTHRQTFGAGNNGPFYGFAGRPALNGRDFRQACQTPYSYTITLRTDRVPELP